MGEREDGRDPAEMPSMTETRIHGAAYCLKQASVCVKSHRRDLAMLWLEMAVGEVAAAIRSNTPIDEEPR